MRATLAANADEFMRLRQAEWDSKRGLPSIRMKEIGRKGFEVWARDNWAMGRQSNFEPKVLVIERLRFVRFEGERVYEWGGATGTIEIRLGYYVHSPNLGRWTWGQFALLAPANDIDALISAARANGTLDPA